MKIRVALIVLTSLVGIFVVADKVVEAVVRRQIERLVAGSGAEVSLGRVAVNLPRRSVSVRGARVRLWHNDAATLPAGIVALDAEFDLIEARGVRLSGGFRSLSVDLRRATLMTGPALIETGAARVSAASTGAASAAGMTAAVEVDSLAVTMNDPTDKTRISLHGLSLAGLNVDALLGGGRDDDLRHGARSGNRSGGTFGGRRAVAADSVAVERAVVVSSKNRKIAAPAHYKPLLWQTIQRLPVALDIPKVRVRDLDVTYRELAAEAAEWGEVTLDRGRLTITNLTNITSGNTLAGRTNLTDPRAGNPAALTSADPADPAASAPGGRFMTVELAATLMRTGEMNVRAQFPVDSLDNHWEMSGRIGRSDLANFNRAVEPLTGLRITSGELDALDFRTEGTRTSSHVRLTMRYDGLAVELLRRSDHHRRALASWALNDLLVRDANPDRNGRLRTSEGTFDRDTAKSTFNFLWHSLLPGVKQTVL